MNKFYMISPDGLTDGRKYSTRGEAESAIKTFVERYQRQGYYKTAEGVRLSLEALPMHCKVSTNPLGDDTVPCKYCGVATPMTQTQLCDPCWELENLVRRDTNLAQRIINSVKSESL